MLRIGLIGAGRIAHVHARSIAGNPDTTLALVADVVADAAKSLADAHGARSTDDIDAVFTDPEVDAAWDLVRAEVTEGRQAYVVCPLIDESEKLEVASATETFERDFWKAEDIDAFYKSKGNADLPSARVLAAGVAEWRRSTQGQVIDREGTRDRLATTMGAAVAKEIDELSDRLLGRALRGAVRHRVGHHAQLHHDRESAEHQPRRRRAGYRGGAVRDRDRPVRRHPGSDRVQPLQPWHQPDRGAVEPLRRRVPRDLVAPARPRALRH